ncbi:MAG: Helix-hairpin-helix motif protein [Syntrophus sp. PtaB.Bin138]|nr:MAG: Helix-hairpin-helix motif protein [Syntrophus sp. PtaB.Bin138]
MKRLCIQLLWGLVALLLASTTTFAAPDTDKPSSRQSRASAKKEKSGKPAYGEGLLDINTAEAGQLKTLPGLTDEDVKKIIAGRPYTRKNQLKQKKIIAPEQYEGIKKKIVAKKTTK